jgi:hypothetical protein
MELAEASKICRSCGEDLRHKRRCKSSDGTYLCPKCTKAENRWDRRLLAKLADKKLKRLALYIILAGIGAVVIWAIIDVISQVDLALS